MSSYTKEERGCSTKQMRDFIDALRHCLGMGPLYGRENKNGSKFEEQPAAWLGPTTMAEPATIGFNYAKDGLPGRNDISVARSKK